MNVFKDPDDGDDECFGSSFGTLEDAMMSLPMACYYPRFISDALDWCCGDGCEFSHAHEGFMVMPNKQTRRKTQQKDSCRGSMNILGSFIEIISVFIKI